MTKEQEVIKNIKTYIHDWVNESVDEDGYERYVIDEWDKEFMNDIETVLSMLKEKDTELKKKDKIIDLMAEEIKIPIIEPTIIIKNFDIKAENKFTNTTRYMTKEEVKQYFESKVEEYYSCSVPGMNMHIDIFFSLEQAEAIEHILEEREQDKKKIKELEEHLKKYYDGELYTAKQLKNIEENQKKYFINKQKLKDKIEELKKEYEDSKDKNGESEYYYPDCTIRKLEELLNDK